MPLLYIKTALLYWHQGMLLKLVWILIVFGGKYHQENAKNGIP